MKWEKLQLKDLVTMKYGKMPKKQDVIEEGYPIYSGYRITSYHKEYLFKEPQLIVVARGVGGTGDVKISPPFCYLTNLSIALLTNDNIVDRYFLKYRLSVQNLRSLDSGAAQSQITIGALEQFETTIPPLSTQRHIASILSAYDDLIENNLKRIKLLEEKAFLSYKGIVKSEKLTEFTIEELVNVVMGQSPKSDTYTDEKEDNLPFHQGVTNFTNYFVEHKTYCKAPIKIAEKGDILFSVRAPVGRINFTNDKICIGRGLCAFRSKHGLQNYFYHQLKEFFFTEDVIGNGAIFNAVTKVELMRVKLKSPSKKVQIEFEVEAETIYNLILNLSKQNTKLREARDILLPRLMSGEIEV